jgi:predicted ATPase
VGRDQEQEDVGALIDASRIVTLTGSGGAGKTSLALQVARAQVAQHADGVWFIDLAPVTDPDVVAVAAAGVLGVTTSPDRSVMDALTETIAGRDLLLVLDNCEHVLPAAASFAQAFLRACPRARVLATSRERLAIEGERVFRVPSLSLPPRDVAGLDQLERSDAFQLFGERAAAYGAGLTSADEIAAAVSICHRLDGIPLALELAAARLPALSVVELVVTPFDADRRRAEIPGLRARLGDEGYQAAFERGRSLARADALALAVAPPQPQRATFA